MIDSSTAESQFTPIKINSKVARVAPINVQRIAPRILLRGTPSSCINMALNVGTMTIATKRELVSVMISVLGR